jgi:hypothetical protein
LVGLGLQIDDDEVLDYLQEKVAPRPRFRNRQSSTESGNEDEIDNSPTASRSQSKYPRAHEIMQIARGSQLSSSPSNGGATDSRGKGPRVNFTLKELENQTERQLWKRLLEAITLDHVQRGPAGPTIEPDVGYSDPMMKDINKRYRQLFGEDAPELTENQFRTVIAPSIITLILVPK